MQDWMLDFAEYVRELLPEEFAEPFVALVRPAIRLLSRRGGFPAQWF
ncbi:hypothetical protein [Nonomuraea sp. NPDC046570]